MKRIFFFTLLVVSLFTGCGDKGEQLTTTPTINTISPQSGGPATTIRITGSGFNTLADSAGCVKVNFANQQVCANRLDDNTLEVQVPYQAGDGPLCIIYNGNRICSNQPFNYIPGNPYSNSYVRLADGLNSPVNQVAVMVATDNAILAGFQNWWKYDPDLNSWSPMAAPPDKMTRCATFTFNGKAYVFGGTNAFISNKLQCFDPATGQWTYKTPMPAAGRGDAVAFLYNNKVYIAGGTDNYALGMNTVARQLWQYDPVADSWTRKADMPQGAGDGSYALKLGSKFYFPGFGYGAQEYDPATDSWRQFWPTQDLLPYAAVISDKDFPLGYIIGGRAGSYETGEIARVSLNASNDGFFFQTYSQAPQGGYNTVSSPFYAVLNNELYYGLGYFNAAGQVHVQGNQFWRFRY